MRGRQIGEDIFSCLYRLRNKKNHSHNYNRRRDETAKKILFMKKFSADERCEEGRDPFDGEYRRDESECHRLELGESIADHEEGHRNGQWFPVFTEIFECIFQGVSIERSDNDHGDTNRGNHEGKIGCGRKTEAREDEAVEKSRDAIESDTEKNRTGIRGYKKFAKWVEERVMRF